MTIKKIDYLFLVGTAKTTSSKDLPSIPLTYNDGDQLRYSEQDRDSDYPGESTNYHGR